MDELPPQPPPAPEAPRPPSAVPPIIQAPPASRTSSGTIWKVLTFVFLALFCLSVLFHWLDLTKSIALRGHASADREHTLEEVAITSTNSDNKIAVIKVEGVITSEEAEDRSGMNLAEFISEQLKAAAKDSDVRAVILKVDSPGGEVLASDDINEAITRFQKETDKPVVASMGALAASGGYYICAPCRWIVANELTITGSIGVIMESWNYRLLMDKVGLRPEVFKSGRFKDMLSDEQEPDTNSLAPADQKTRREEDQMVQSLINETYQRFKTVVKTGRARAAEENDGGGRALAKNWQDYADGRVLSGRSALDLGFVDELGGFETAVRRAEKLAGISSASLVEYRVAVDFQTVLSHLFSKSAAPSLKVDLGFGTPRLKAGRPYYLWAKAVGQ